MPYYPSPYEIRWFEQSELEHQLAIRFRHCDMKRGFIAYKGGVIERDLIVKMGWNGFNLEDIDCPKAIHGINICKPSIHGNCSYAHCALNDVLCYSDFFRKYLKTKK